MLNYLVDLLFLLRQLGLQGDLLADERPRMFTVVLVLPSQLDVYLDQALRLRLQLEAKATILFIS